MRRETIIGLLILFYFNSSAQVDLQTGAAKHSIPILNYKNERDRLNYQVSIDYVSGNGIKVTDVSSDVGMGWVLNAESKIIRIKNEEPDDQVYMSFSFNSIQIPAGILSYGGNVIPNSSYSLDPTQKLKWVPRTIGYFNNFDKDVHKDRQRDVFVLNLNGKLIRFLIGNNKEILPLENTKIKFLQPEELNMIDQGIATTIKAFEVIDEDGIKYRFENRSSSEIMNYKTKDDTYTAEEKYSYTDVIFDNYGVQHSCATCQVVKVELKAAYPTGFFTIDQWLITSITNPLTGKFIKFNYISKVDERRIGIDAFHSRSKFENTGTISSDAIIINELFSRTKYDRLASIDFPDGLNVEFGYYNSRKDFTGRNCLNKIFIKQNGYNTKVYKLDYFYTYKGIKIEESQIPLNPIKDDLSLFLNKIEIESTESVQSNLIYKFEYSGCNEQQKLTKRFALNRDLYDYPLSLVTNIENENQINIRYLFLYLSTSTYPIFRKPVADVNIYSTGILKSIILPEGGKIEFTYEINQMTSNNSECSSCPNGGLRVANINKYSNYPERPLVTKYVYERSWGYEDIIPYFYRTSRSLLIKPTNGPISSGRNYNNYSNAQMQFTFAKSYNSNVKALKNLIKVDQPAGASFNATVNNAMIIYNLVSFFSVFIGVPLNQTSYYEYRFNNKVAFLNSPSSENIIKPMYSKVSVYNSELNVNGHIEYEFTDNVFCPFYAPPYPPSNQYPSPYINPFANINYYGTPFMTSRMRFASFAYGLPQTTKWFDKNGNLIKFTEYKYKNPQQTITYRDDINYLSNKTEVPETLFSPKDSEYDFENFRANTTPVISFTYGVYTGRIELEKMIEKNYSINNVISEKIQEFKYHPLNYKINYIKSTNSKGEIVEVNTYYPEDYTLTGAIQLMKERNIIFPVSNETWITRAGVKQMLATSVNEFATIPNGDIKNIKTYSLKSNSPVTLTSTTFNPSVLIRDNNLIKSDNLVTYDNVGNVIQVQSKGINSSTIFGYNNTLPISTITNAIPSEVAYTSFEMNSTGNWQFSNSAITTEQGAKTGEAAFNLGGLNVITSSIYFNTNKNYIFSYWVKGAKPILSGKTPWNSTTVITEISMSKKKSINGWDYYEGELQCSSPTNISITASNSNPCYIDEIRLYPSNAQITTFTYKQGIEKSSETDTNGRTTYYQYDELRRLITVRNENWDIIKAYQYNYKQ